MKGKLYRMGQKPLKNINAEQKIIGKWNTHLLRTNSKTINTSCVGGLIIVLRIFTQKDETF
jgi:hypothetical protein